MSFKFKKAENVYVQLKRHDLVYIFSPKSRHNRLFMYI